MVHADPSNLIQIIAYELWTLFQDSCAEVNTSDASPVQTLSLGMLELKKRYGSHAVSQAVAHLNQLPMGQLDTSQVIEDVLAGRRLAYANC